MTIFDKEINNRLVNLQNDTQGTRSIVERTENELRIVKSECQIFQDLNDVLKQEIKKYNTMMIDTRESMF